MNDLNRSHGVAEALRSFPRYQPGLTASMTASRADYRGSSQALPPRHADEFAAAGPRFVTRQSREASSRQSSSGESERPSSSREARQQTSDGVGSKVREGHQKDKFMESRFFKIGGHPPAEYGLCNLGNTCYQNAGMQPLLRTPWFWDWFAVAFDQTFICPRSPYRGHVASVFADLMREFASNGPSLHQQGVVDPTNFRRVFARNKKEFRGRRQHDSAEFLVKLLECLHEDTNRIQEKPTFHHMDDLPGETATQASDRWLADEQRRSSSIVSDFRNFESNRTLPLTIPDETAEVDLDECLKTFCKIEVLKGEDVWFCPNKEVTIIRPPPVLVVVLGRFRKDKFGGTEGIFNAKRINTPVSFKTSNLCLADVDGLCQHSEDPSIGRQYDLYGVTHHDGILQGGHYYSYVKLVVNGVVTWVRFDDKATEYFMPEEQIQGPGAYILWYAARDMSKTFQEKRSVPIAKLPDPSAEDEEADDVDSDEEDSPAAVDLENFPPLAPTSRPPKRSTGPQLPPRPSPPHTHRPPPAPPAKPQTPPTTNRRKPAPPASAKRPDVPPTQKKEREVPLPRSIDNPVAPSSPSSVVDKDTEDITSPLDDSTDIAAPAAAGASSHLPAPTVRPSKPSTVPPPAPAAPTPPAAALSPPPVHGKAPSAITTTTEKEETAERAPGKKKGKNRGKDTDTAAQLRRIRAALAMMEKGAEDKNKTRAPAKKAAGGHRMLTKKEQEERSRIQEKQREEQERKKREEEQDQKRREEEEEQKRREEEERKEEERKRLEEQETTRASVERMSKLAGLVSRCLADELTAAKLVSETHQLLQESDWHQVLPSATIAEELLKAIDAGVADESLESLEAVSALVAKIKPTLENIFQTSCIHRHKLRFLFAIQKGTLELRHVRISPLWALVEAVFDALYTQDIIEEQYFTWV
ncbi:unnamed protein product, partial [Vitrella brassicaformis CCMP3155]